MDAVEQELLDAIARDPEDPQPYLVYADWLQGQGGLRGELREARIQIEAGAARVSSVMWEIAEATWPCLERLHVWNADSVDAMVAVLRRDDLVLLGELGVANCAFADPMCSAIARSPLAPQLFRLSLVGGMLTDAGVAALVSARLPNLALLDVSETFVTEEGVRRLRDVVSEVVARDLRTGAPRIAIPALERPDNDDYDD